MKIRFATLDDIDKIMEIEKKSWIPSMQATKKTKKKRIESINNGVLIAEHDGNSVGLLEFRMDHVNGKFAPKEFKTFSNPSLHKEEGNSIFFFNICVIPEMRRKGVGSYLVEELIKFAKTKGIKRIYTDMRIPSYNGSAKNAQEKIEQSIIIKKSLDKYMKTGKIPSEEELINDPVINFHMKCGHKPVQIMPNFYPSDEPSGGFRVIGLLNAV